MMKLFKGRKKKINLKILRIRCQKCIEHKIKYNMFVVNILEGDVLDYSTYRKSPETKELAVIQQLKEWLATNIDGMLQQFKRLRK